MKFLTKSQIGALLIVVAASSALFAQDSAPDKLPNPASVLEARQIVGKSLVATEHSWRAREDYIYVERDEDRRLDSTGKGAIGKYRRHQNDARRRRSL